MFLTPHLASHGRHHLESQRSAPALHEHTPPSLLPSIPSILLPFFLSPPDLLVLMAPCTNLAMRSQGKAVSPKDYSDFRLFDDAIMLPMRWWTSVVGANSDLRERPAATDVCLERDISTGNLWTWYEDVRLHTGKIAHGNRLQPCHIDVV